MAADPPTFDPTAPTQVRYGVLAFLCLLSFILYLDQFFSPIQQLSQVFDTWQQARASMVRINELMDTPDRVKERLDHMQQTLAARIFSRSLRAHRPYEDMLVAMGRCLSDRCSVVCPI